MTISLFLWVLAICAGFNLFLGVLAWAFGERLARWWARRTMRKVAQGLGMSTEPPPVSYLRSSHTCPACGDDWECRVSGCIDPRISPCATCYPEHSDN